MAVFKVPVAVGMVVQMAVRMAVFVFVLKLADGVAAPLPEGIGETVQIAQPGILHKGGCGLFLDNMPLVHDHGPAG
jgi:hypothetical protein